jgi:hypothetical protein
MESEPETKGTIAIIDSMINRSTMTVPPRSQRDVIQVQPVFCGALTRCNLFEPHPFLHQAFEIAAFQCVLKHGDKVNV